MVSLLGLILTLGGLMTSCFSDSKDDNKTTQNVIALCENGTIQQYGGGILVPTSKTNVPTTTGVYTFTIEFDPTTWSDNKLSVNITTAPVNLTNANVKTGTSDGNINLYDLEYSGEMFPTMFNENYMLVPCIFWMENVSLNEYDAELNKHKFSILVPEDLYDADKVLNLTLIDEVTDPELERSKSSWVYQAFNIGSVIKNFKVANGGIKTIRVWGTTNRTSYDPTDGRSSKKYVDIDLTDFQ